MENLPFDNTFVKRHDYTRVLSWAESASWFFDPPERAILAYLARHTTDPDTGEVAYLSMDTIAAGTGYAKSRVQAAIRNLEAGRRLTIVKHEGQKWPYTAIGWPVSRLTGIRLCAPIWAG